MSGLAVAGTLGISRAATRAGRFELLALGLVATLFHAVLADRFRMALLPDDRQQPAVIHEIGDDSSVGTIATPQLEAAARKRKMSLCRKNKHGLQTESSSACKPTSYAKVFACDFCRGRLWLTIRTVHSGNSPLFSIAGTSRRAGT